MPTVRPLKSPRCFAGAAVASDLLVVETVRSYADDAAQKRQVFGDRDVEVKLGSALVVCFVVLGVEVHASESSQFKAYLAADVTERDSRLERPVILAHVGQLALIIVAGGGIDAETKVRFQVATKTGPAEHERVEQDVTDAVGRVAHSTGEGASSGSVTWTSPLALTQT